MADVTVAASPTEATLRTAIETTALDGDTVYLTSPVAVTLTTGPLLITNKAIRIKGTGRNTVITGMASQHIFQVTNAGASGADLKRLQIEDMTLVGNATGLDGISIVGTAGKGKYTGVLIANVDISACRNGVAVSMPNIGADAMVYLVMDGMTITGSRARGVTIANVSMARMQSCEVNSSTQNGIFASICPNFQIVSCASETNNQGLGSGIEGDAQVLIKLCHSFTVLGLDMENLPTAAAATKTGLVISNCTGGSLSGVNVIQGGSQIYPNSIGVHLVNSARAIQIGSITASYIAHPIYYDRSSQQGKVATGNAVPVILAPSTLAANADGPAVGLEAPPVY